MLRNDISAEFSRGAFRPDRCRDDYARACGHQSDSLARHIVGADDVDLDHANERALDLIAVCGYRGDALKARVVDEHIKPAEVANRLANCGAIGDVADEG